MSAKEVFDAYFDDAWYEGAAKLVIAYKERGARTGLDLRAWERTSEYHRAAVLFNSSAAAQAARAQWADVSHELGDLRQLDRGWRLIMRSAQRNPRYRDDLDRLLALGMGVAEIVRRVGAGGMFTAPDARGRPRRRQRDAPFSYWDRLRYAALAVRLLIERAAYDREDAVRAISDRAYDCDGVRRQAWPGPGTAQAFRKAIYPMFDRVLWRLEASRFHREEKKRAILAPSTSAADKP
ncbi:MAG: hypothetical protein AB7Q23_17895 [Hyphomonadaceae bacterium]